MNGKRDDFTLADFRRCAGAVGRKRGRAETLREEVATAVEKWPGLAREARIATTWSQQIRKHHRLGVLATKTVR